MKALSVLVNPLTQVFILFLVGLYLFSRRKARMAASFLCGSVVWLYLCSNPLLSSWLLERLEADYPPTSAQALPEADAIVLLGGAVRGLASAQTLADLSDMGDRLLFTVTAYKAGRAPIILVTGGAALGEVPEAVMIADILVAMGVPRKSIRLETRNRVTQDNARYTSETLAELGAKSVLLVTSAFHMRRAMLVFEPLEILVWPAATDYQVLMKNNGATFKDWVPSVKALQRTTWFAHELVGYWYYRLLA